MSRDAVEQIDRPDIVLADAGPLIHLAQAEALNLLHQIGRAVVVVDMVADEVTRDLGKPGAQASVQWIQEGTREGSNQPIRVEATETGRAIRLARVTEPDFTMRNGGETAIVEWLVETIQGSSDQTLVLYENGRAPRVVATQGIDADIDILTTRAFLELSERRGLIPSASEAWERVEAAAPTVNPRIAVFSQRRPPASTRTGVGAGVRHKPLDQLD